MKMLYVGTRSGNSLSLANTFENLGVELKCVDPETLVHPEGRIRRHVRIQIDRFLNLFDKQPAGDTVMQSRGMRRLRRDRLASAAALEQINQDIRNIARDFLPDITFLYHSHYIDAKTLDLCREYGPIFCFFTDDALTPERYTLRAAEALKRIDCVMSTKSFNIPEFHSLGIPVALFVNNSYDPDILHPVTLNKEDQQQFCCDVSFIGNNYIRARADFLAALVEACPTVRFGVWGNHWSRLLWPYYRLRPRLYQRYRRLFAATHGPATYEDICKIHTASKINLGLLYAGDGPTRIRDYQTSRSVEIPATGGFMLAEYTDEHAAIFEENHEAVYFRGFEDLVSKIYYYLGHENERIQIARAGYERCQKSDYTWEHRARTLIDQYNQWCAQHNRILADLIPLQVLDNQPRA